MKTTSPPTPALQTADQIACNKASTYPTESRPPVLVEDCGMKSTVRAGVPSEGLEPAYSSSFEEESSSDGLQSSESSLKQAETCLDAGKMLAFMIIGRLVLIQTLVYCCFCCNDQL